MTTHAEKEKIEKAKITQAVEAIPEYARAVLVPIANPETAADLLHLAVAMAHPDGGKVIALIVSLGDAERDSTTAEGLGEIVEKIREEGHEIGMEVVTAPTVARGILDSAREFGADLTILGAEQPKRGEVKLGKIVESVMTTATCDVLIYRQGQHSDFKRVVVPIDRSFRSQVSARLGLCLSRTYDATIEAMHVQGSYHSQFEGLARIEEAISKLPEHRRIKRTVVEANSTVEGLLARTGDEDLIIVGFDQRSDFERTVFGDISRGILNRAPGPVILVSRARVRDDVVNRSWRRFVNWVRPTLTAVEQDDIIRQAQLNASLNIDYVTLILISAAIATLGLLLNSAAVIIGAMLVAPLMSPLISLSSGLTIGRVRMAARATVTLTIGVVMALVVAIVLGALLPIDLPTQEMLGRGRPTLIDAAVALASGMIGAYATARKDIPAALAGVAIAAALMPPICTVGLGVALGDNSLAFGALILFLTNIICIIGAGMVVFVYLGMNLRRYDDVPGWVQIAALLLFTLISLPVFVEVISLTQDAVSESNARAEIQRALSPAELVDIEFRDGDLRRVIATVRSTQPLDPEQVIALEDRLYDVLGEHVQIDLVVMPVVRFDVGLQNSDDPEATPEIEGMIDGQPALETTPEATPEMTPEATLETD